MAQGSTEDVQVLQDVAAATVNSDGTAKKIRGATVAKTGTGVYEMDIEPVSVDGGTVTQAGNLSGGLPASEAVYESAVIGSGAPPAILRVEDTSDTKKTISIRRAGAAVDSDFQIVARRLLG